MNKKGRLKQFKDQITEKVTTKLKNYKPRISN